MLCQCAKNLREKTIQCIHPAKQESNFCGIHRNCKTSVVQPVKQRPITYVQPAHVPVPVSLQSGDIGKQQIIDLFRANVKGVKICTEGQNTKHCGKEGHWLETKMGIKHNARNEPDINGYEMKKDASKTTLGDFSASEYAFSGKNKRNLINHLNNWTDEIKIGRTDFIRYFGNSNPHKSGRYSWSGSCVPTYNNWNDNGQKLLVLENNDIVVYYSFSKDKRSRKTVFPQFLQADNTVTTHSEIT